MNKYVKTFEKWNQSDESVDLIREYSTDNFAIAPSKCLDVDTVKRILPKSYKSIRKTLSLLKQTVGERKWVHVHYVVFEDVKTKEVYRLLNHQYYGGANQDIKFCKVFLYKGKEKELIFQDYVDTDSLIKMDIPNLEENFKIIKQGY